MAQFTVLSGRGSAALVTDSGMQALGLVQSEEPTHVRVSIPASSNTVAILPVSTASCFTACEGAVVLPESLVQFALPQSASVMLEPMSLALCNRAARSVNLQPCANSILDHSNILDSLIDSIASLAFCIRDLLPIDIPKPFTHVDDTCDASGIFSIAASTTVHVTPFAPPSPSRPFANLHSQMMELSSYLDAALFKSQLHRQLGMNPPKTIMVSGPSGVGKSILIDQAVSSLNIPSFPVHILDLALFLTNLEKEGGTLTSSTACPFRKAITLAKAAAPAAIIFENFDYLCTEPIGTGVEFSICIARVASLLHDLMVSDARICVLASCRDTESLPTHFKRVGENASFGARIALEMPSRAQRELIAKHHLSGVSLVESDFSNVSSGDSTRGIYAHQIAQATPGFVARDISNLVKRAKFNAAVRNRSITQPSEFVDLESITSRLQTLSVSDKEDVKVSWKLDFVQALTYLTPSQSADSGFEVLKPDLAWDRVGGYNMVKNKLKTLVVNPIENPKTYERLKIKPPSGILLYGPSGCGKSLLVKTLAANCPMNFIAVNGSKIFSKYLGDSESKVRQVFQIARKVAPCIIFFDEIDILGTRREWSEDGASGVNERVLSTLLNEMDGVSEQKGVIVIGATNRPEKLDDALLRPGRLDHHIHVFLPTLKDRVEILDTLLKSTPNHLDTSRIAAATEGFTAADLTVLIREAGYLAIRQRERVGGDELVLEWRHVSAALAGALKGPLDAVFQKAFQASTEDNSMHGDSGEATFWNSFGASSLSNQGETWGVGMFAQTTVENADVQKVLACREGWNAGSSGWWRPGSVSDEELEKHAKGELLKILVRFLEHQEEMPLNQADVELYQLFHMCGLETSPRVFGILMQLLRLGCSPAAVASALRVIALEKNKSLHVPETRDKPMAE
ncbi:AAA ATPase cdc48 [Chytriomyces hyalinus]|nr:AAA ATPase cdc48 [Chytriomyces hyalinus]